MDRRPRQLELPLQGRAQPEEKVERRQLVPRQEEAPRRLRLIQGEGQARSERLRSRDDLARVLVGAAGDMLLKRISAPRANEIQRRVEKLMDLFDRVEREPVLEALLRRDLDALEELVREPKVRSKR